MLNIIKNLRKKKKWKLIIWKLSFMIRTQLLKSPAADYGRGGTSCFLINNGAVGNSCPRNVTQNLEIEHEKKNIKKIILIIINNIIIINTKYSLK